MNTPVSSSLYSSTDHSDGIEEACTSDMDAQMDGRMDGRKKEQRDKKTDTNHQQMNE